MTKSINGYDALIAEIKSIREKKHFNSMSKVDEGTKILRKRIENKVLKINSGKGTKQDYIDYYQYLLDSGLIFQSHTSHVRIALVILDDRDINLKKLAKLNNESEVEMLSRLKSYLIFEYGYEQAEDKKDYLINLKHGINPNYTITQLSGMD